MESFVQFKFNDFILSFFIYSAGTFLHKFIFNYLNLYKFMTKTINLYKFILFKKSFFI